MFFFSQENIFHAIGEQPQGREQSRHTMASIVFSFGLKSDRQNVTLDKYKTKIPSVRCVDHALYLTVSANALGAKQLAFPEGVGLRKGLSYCRINDKA